MAGWYQFDGIGQFLSKDYMFGQSKSIGDTPPYCKTFQNKSDTLVTLDYEGIETSFAISSQDVNETSLA